MAYQVADGVLLVSPNVFADDRWKQQLLQNEDDGKKGLLQQPAFHSTTLAVWEMKSLTVGTAQVMEEIVEIGLTHANSHGRRASSRSAIIDFGKLWKSPARDMTLASMLARHLEHYRLFLPHLPPIHDQPPCAKGSGALLHNVERLVGCHIRNVL